MQYKLCNECGNECPEREFQSTTGKLCYHAEVCNSCFENLESDNED